jgi:hypothetical protein
MHHTLPSAETYHSNAPFFTSSKGLLCGLVGVLEETYFSERCQDEGRQGSIFSDARVCRQAPLSQPTLRRSTPIALTGLRSVDGAAHAHGQEDQSEGVMGMQVVG